MSVRRLFLVAVSASTLALGAGASAHAVPPDNVSHFCKSAGDFGQKHGGCVASLKAGNITPNVANFCRDPGVRAEAAELVGADEVNHGQCVQIMRDFLSS
jgi:hypothetical protein